ncbi:MAG: hypothetical protein AVDCRST_MAG19-4601 [uncultured Thermomicrobiales bacterium]|uniref:Uncharacterized protein n=1 Tax=uncultured Thermomicrobiales bacterium TaxID=1645740 RepID=A0A6J4VUC4_9BACT|nr:MAG: hypothetical protein AVDCRST_MAG19-4601 [uncultured Thermomicrobiales bacterium]
MGATARSTGPAGRSAREPPPGTTRRLRQPTPARHPAQRRGDRPQRPAPRIGDGLVRLAARVRWPGSFGRPPTWQGRLAGRPRLRAGSGRPGGSRRVTGPASGAAGDGSLVRRAVPLRWHGPVGGQARDVRSRREEQPSATKTPGSPLAT